LAIGELSVLVADGLRSPVADSGEAPGSDGTAIPGGRLMRPSSPLPGMVATAATFIAVFLVVGGPLGAVPSWLGYRSAASDHSFVPDWARWNYAGYERKPAYTEYRGVVATMAGLG